MIHSISYCQVASPSIDSLARESQHFDFYAASSDFGVLDSLATTLEQNYSRITGRLGISIDNKIQVKVFPDVKSFHMAIGQPQSPEWVVGTWNGAALMIVSPLNPGSMHTYASLIQVAIHEFVHMAVYYACGEKGLAGVPRWLNEGYAQYEAGQINNHVRRSVRAMVQENAPPTWAQLDRASAMEFGSMNGYGFSASIVEFLVQTYGIEKLVMLIKKPEKMEDIYGSSKTSLENEWVQFIKAYQVK